MANVIDAKCSTTLPPERAADPLVGDVARPIAQTASANAPRLTGRLAAGFAANQDTPGEYVVTNDVPYARYVEYGSKHNPRPAAMLGRAVASARVRYG